MPDRYTLQGHDLQIFLADNNIVKSDLKENDTYLKYD
jgi:hypothetical protein